MKIICPECSHENKIEYSEYIKCTKCNESFKGKTFFADLVIPTILGVALSTVVGITGYNIASEDRYPINVEYALVDTCVNSSNSRMSRDQLIYKKDICLCTVERTISSVDYDEYKSDRSLFKEIFQKEVKYCQ